MSSIKKVLCLKVNKGYEHLFTAGKVYDVTDSNDFDINTGTLHRVVTDANYPTPANIVIGGFCIYGEWQPLEEYVCMYNAYLPLVKKGDILLGYVSNGFLECPSYNRVFGCLNGQFKKLSEIKSTSDAVNAELKPRYEVRHVIYDTKDNQSVNDAMGECYITLAEAQELCDEMNSPKVMKTKYTKEVEYFGMKLLVPDDAKFMATSKYGTVLASPKRMTTSITTWRNNSSIYTISLADINGIDWKDTLVEIK